MAKTCAITNKNSIVAGGYSNRVRATKFNPTGMVRKYPNLQKKKIFIAELGKSVTLTISTRETPHHQEARDIDYTAKGKVALILNYKKGARLRRAPFLILEISSSGYFFMTYLGSLNRLFCNWFGLDYRSLALLRLELEQHSSRTSFRGLKTSPRGP